jgi:MFS family permease
MRMPAVSRLLTDVTPLRQSRQFRRLWAGTLLSSVGSALTGFAVPLQVYDITRSSLAVGAIGIASVVPTLTVGLLGGSLADAMDRRNCSRRAVRRRSRSRWPRRPLAEPPPSGFSTRSLPCPPR